MKLKIGLDIDGVLADWANPFFKRFSPKNDAHITRICGKILAKDRDFWLNLPVIQYPIGFEPTLYCTKRSCLKTYSKEWLDKEFITVEEICGSLDFELINVGELEDYE